MCEQLRGISNPALLTTKRTKKRRKLRHFQFPLDFMESHSGSSLKLAMTYRDSVRRSRDPVPVRKMTHCLSKSFHADVPHYWLCDGRLLVLSDPANPNNIGLFRVSLFNDGDR